MRGQIAAYSHKRANAALRVYTPVPTLPFGGGTCPARAHLLHHTLGPADKESEKEAEAQFPHRLPTSRLYDASREATVGLWLVCARTITDSVDQDWLWRA